MLNMTVLRLPCLENPGDGGAWGAAVYGVAQSRTRLKRLSSSNSSSRASLVAQLVKQICLQSRRPGLISGPERSTGEGIGYRLQYYWVSLVAQMVKNPPVMWETWVRSLGWEDSPEKGTATHSSILA